MRITMTRLRDHHDADEALMDAAMKMHRKWHRIRGHANPVALAYAILKAATTDFYRARARRQEREIPISGTFLTAYADVLPGEVAENLDKLERALAILEDRAPKQAECLRLSYLANQNVSEIAAHLHITEQAAKVNISLALRALKSLMELPAPRIPRQDQP